MPSYRFCRPDDMPRLVRAVNECYNPHFPDSPPLTLEDLQREVRELSVWPSNCMIAADGDTPIAVSIATKREREVLLQRVGVRPGHQRQGHGRHLVTSLSQKLAVLGPSRLIAEIPEDWEAAASFLQDCGYCQEATYTDFLLDSPLAPPPSSGAIIPVTVQELLENGLLGSEADRRQDCSWQRQTPTLIELGKQLTGLAVASPDRIEAFLLQRDTGIPAPEFRNAAKRSGSEIVRLGVQNREHGDLFLSLLFRSCCAADSAPVRIPRLSALEAEHAPLQSLGFRPTARTVRYAVTAKPL